MRSNPAEYHVEAPPNLQDAITILADNRRSWTPIAGGTDLMVQYAAGQLAARNLIGLWKIAELRRIEPHPGEIRVGAGSTFTDLRESEPIRREFPLLAQVAAWVGGIANQNRGTLGGNIANASPAGDSLPALLAYDADLVLVSNRGMRRIPYRSFHNGYKKTALATGELIQSICLPRRFTGYVSFARKVGTRNAQAISKVCVAALGRKIADIVEDVRIAAGSVAPIPLRLSRIEQMIRGKRLDRSLIETASNALRSEIQPIDDGRSTSRYRAAVAANLVVEFLENLATEPPRVSDVLRRWNALALDVAESEILPCCGSRAWAHGLAMARPIADESALFTASDDIWNSLSGPDWNEAFRSHPRLGESKPVGAASAESVRWASHEQRGISASDDAAKRDLAEANREYEDKFHRIFIVCAADKTVPAILEAVRRRLRNDAQTELLEAAEQQRQITRLRLQKWLSE